MNNVFVFDIETIPDIDSGRRLYDFPDLSDRDAGKAMLNLRQQKTGSEFLPLPPPSLSGPAGVLSFSMIDIETL